MLTIHTPSTTILYVLVTKYFSHGIRFCDCEGITLIWIKWFLGDEKAAFSSSFKVFVNHIFYKSFFLLK